MSLSADRVEALRLRDKFAGMGATAVDCAVLQPAEVLLDLYGEDIRGRAFVTFDPVRGEVMLRPDFTVPVVQTHLETGQPPARYTYAGEVFRRQEEFPDRSVEYFQTGYEIFDDAAPEEAEAEVFSAISGALDGLPVRAVTGDIGILMAAVSGLETSAARKAALMRHIWRPRRFRALLERFAGRAEVSEARTALLAGKTPEGGPVIGVRSVAEIAARVDALRSDAQEPPLSDTQIALIGAVLGVSESCDNALQQLRDIAVDMPAIGPAVARFARRCDVMTAQGIDVGALAFEASYGRTSMEYYDGFVFGVMALQHPDWPPVASGGRYDALAGKLGGQGVTAVGAVIRPDLRRRLEAGT